MINDNLLARVYRTSLWIGGIGTWLLLMGRDYALAAGFALGVALSLSAILLLEMTVKVIVRPSVPQGMHAGVLVVGFLKYILIGACFFVLIRVSWFSLGSLAVGLVVPQAVILMKAVGSYLADYPREAERAAEEFSPR